MKKYYLFAVIFLASPAIFCQTLEKNIHAAASEPKTKEISAIADTKLIDKKAIAADTKKKKSKREKNHKECSRMKS